MGDIDARAVVRATPDRIYAFLADPSNAPQYIMSIKRITAGPEGEPKIGDRYHAAAEFMGNPTNITLRLNELSPGRRVVLGLQGDPAATISVNLRPSRDGQSTEVNAVLDVPSVPGFMLEMVMGRTLREGIQRLATMFGGG